MNRRPTPETDAVRDNVFDIWGGWSDNAAKKLLKHAHRLERERDEALAYADKLAAGLPEGMLPKDVEVLRDANLALAVALEELNSINAERAEHRGMRKAWIKLDDNRQILEKQLTSERALADRLAGIVEVGIEDLDEDDGDWPQAFAALAAWKEARSE